MILFGLIIVIDFEKKVKNKNIFMICSIGEKQIEEVIKQKKYQKLVDLHDSNEVLEVEIPNM